MQIVLTQNNSCKIFVPDGSYYKSFMNLYLKKNAFLEQMEKIDSLFDYFE